MIGSVGGESREEYRRFHLGTRHRRLPGQCPEQLPAMHAKRRRPRRRGVDQGSHGAQGIDDAAHRPAAQRGVAVEGRLEVVAGQNAGEQPNAGARVGAIQHRVGSTQPADAVAVERISIRRKVAHPNATRAQARSGGDHVCGRATHYRCRSAPRASAPRISARWLIDLSPGTVTSPSTRSAGATRSWLTRGARPRDPSSR